MLEELLSAAEWHFGLRRVGGRTYEAKVGQYVITIIAPAWVGQSGALAVQGGPALHSDTAMDLAEAWQKAAEWLLAHGQLAPGERTDLATDLLAVAAWRLGSDRVGLLS